MKKNQTKKKQLILQKRKNMCNEIEFRIWDKENKKMLYYNNDIVPCLTLNGVLQDCSKKVPTNVSYKYILMQWTGLKDKNNIKIYTEDVIKFENKIYKIKFFNKWGMFGLIGKSDYKDFTEEDPLGSGGSSTRYKPYVLGEYYQKRIEVVGNIYENKYLLVVLKEQK